MASFSSETAFQNSPSVLFFSLSFFIARGCESSVGYFSPVAGLSPKSLTIVPGGWSTWNENYFYLSCPLYMGMTARRERALIATASIALVAGFPPLVINRQGALTIQQSDFSYLNIFSLYICLQAGIEIGRCSPRRAILLSSLAFGL